jgi:hypothetical protein
LYAAATILLSLNHEEERADHVAAGAKAFGGRCEWTRQYDEAARCIYELLDDKVYERNEVKSDLLAVLEQYTRKPENWRICLRTLLDKAEISAHRALE